MEFLGSFVQYLVIMIILAAIAALGGFLGVKLRKNKNAKEEAMAQNEDTQAEVMTESAKEE